MIEVVDVLSLGVIFIKVFLILDFYGFKLVKVFKILIFDMLVLVSGGINIENLYIWLENGVDVCGFGGLLIKGFVEDIVKNVKKICEIIKNIRKI